MTESLLKTYLKNDNSLDSLEESLLSTGFNMLKNECENIINNHAIDLVYSKINYHSDIRDYDTKYKFMYRLNRMFGPNKYSDDIYKYFDEYFANFEKDYNITTINQTNRDELDSIIINLEQMIVKYDKIMETKKYIILQKINTYQNMIADYNIECLKSSELSFDEFITSLKAIVESSYYGKEKLDSIENYSIFDKIQLDKFHIIVKYLISKEFNRDYLIDMYKTKLINVINNSPERELVRTYILKLYIKTDKDIFNELYSRISPHPLQSNVYNEYNILCKRFEEFMEC